MLDVDWQTLVDAIGLGAVYALMAVGIGLVFGVLRLVNFAYGQLIMAGAYALALASEWDWPAWAGIALCFAVVIALSLAMERVVFRPLREQPPAVMLVATFAVAFLLQSIALLWFGALGKPVTTFVSLNRPISIGDVDIRRINVVAIVVAASVSCALMLLLARTTIGLHLRAAALDFRTARLLGVRGEPRDRVGRAPLRLAGRSRRGDPDRADLVRDAGFALSRDDRRAGRRRARRHERDSSRRRSAASRSASPRGCSAARCRPRRASTSRRSLFGLVIVVLLIRPGGLFTRTGTQVVERA